KRYPSVSLSTLTRYKKKFLSSATLPAGGRPSFVSVSTQQYIGRMLRNGRQDGPKAVQEYLRSIEIGMSLSVVRKLLKRMGFKPRRKNQWRQWVFSDGTRVNLWGSDGNSYYWSDGGDILQSYQTEPHVEVDGGSVLFWSCITANGPGYGTTVMDGSTSLLDTLEYYDMNRNVISFQDGKSLRFVAQQVGVGKSTVERVGKEGCGDRELSKGGRPRLIQDADERYMVRKITKDRVKSAKEVSKTLIGDAGVRTSAQTVRRILHRAGLKAVVKPKRNFISDLQ
ncbi:hypothetical protein INT46_011807, partial [Mucor plumbeus]